MEKSLTVILAVFISLTLLSGCASVFERPHHPYDFLPSSIRSQLESIQSQAEQKATDIQSRRQEAKQSLDNGTISQGEYLIIKNQLDKECDDYFANSQRESQDILNRYYQYRRSLY